VPSQQVQKVLENVALRRNNPFLKYFQQDNLSSVNNVFLGLTVRQQDDSNLSTPNGTVHITLKELIVNNVFCFDD